MKFVTSGYLPSMTSSHSSRGAWIEIKSTESSNRAYAVALYTGCVD
ncbi:hypothetical protein V6C20_15800 [Caldibacillus thermoamylovorans]